MSNGTGRPSFRRRGVAYDGGHEWPRETAPRSRQGTGPATVDDAFGRWLERSLHEQFDAIATEPLPEELPRLINEAGGQRDR